MAELTFRVVTPLPGWDHGAVVTVERSAFVDALIDSGRVVLLADPESEVFDQGDEPEDGEDLLGEVQVRAHVRTEADGDVVQVQAHSRSAPGED